ncbi:tyrosine-type recombinase/integrase [Halococcus agarilyticus]|uniref:tyrosine-type recombinase/integrase n=1 Tax=Halococcus agarilyticus TaxID=1232219 RepID=UPI001E4599E6|nr:tyrosine-type recombinase/integrase [Halococcus agarilyticus]
MVHADPRDALENAKDRITRLAVPVTDRDPNDDDYAQLVGEIAADDAARITEIVEAYDDGNTIRSPPDGESTRSPTTLTTWIAFMSKVARETPLNTLHADPDGDRDTNVNAVIDRFLTGESDLVKKGGISKKTVQKIQFTMRRFYRYHDDLWVDADDINYYSDVGDESGTVDPRDMLTREEILSARQSADHPRDEAMFALLLYTGMRNAALRSLRWRDVDLERGVYKYNPNCDALKGADHVGKWRTLLDAAQPLRDWRNYHPEAENPDAYVFTKKPRWTADDDLDPEIQLSSNSVSYTMRKIKEKAGIEKPMHPHMLRHNFVTIAKEDYELPDSTVKYLIGHEEDSDVMQRVYSHLSDESHNEKAEIAAGIREPDDKSGSRLSPGTCRTCGNALPENARACARCGTVFTPDAQAVENQIETDVKQSYAETEPDNRETMEKVDALDQLLKDPKVKATLLEKIEGH